MQIFAIDATDRRAAVVLARRARLAAEAGELPPRAYYYHRRDDGGRGAARARRIAILRRHWRAADPAATLAAISAAVGGDRCEIAAVVAEAGGRRGVPAVRALLAGPATAVAALAAYIRAHGPIRTVRVSSAQARGRAKAYSYWGATRYEIRLTADGARRTSPLSGRAATGAAMPAPSATPRRSPRPRAASTTTGSAALASAARPN